MRIHITPALLCSLWIQQAGAFGVTRTLAKPPVSSSSLHAVDVVVDAIANGGSAVVEAAAALAPAAAESMASFSPELLNNVDMEAVSSIATKIDLEAVSSIWNEIDLESLATKLSPDSASVVGTAFGAGGFLVGSLTTGASRNGEAKRLEKTIDDKAKEIETLNANLKEAEESQTKIETEKKEAIENLEDQIFLMDQQFEESTETLKQDFEKRIRKEIQTRGEKLEQDLNFKYDIKMMREREEMLQEKLDFIAQETSAKQEETTLAKLELAERNSEIVALQKDLARSEKNKEELRAMIEEGKNPFNAAGYKLKLTDLQKDLLEMEEALAEKEEEVRESKRELEELKVKRSNPLYFVKEIFR